MQCRFMVSDAMMAPLHDNNSTSSREALAQITAALMTADGPPECPPSKKFSSGRVGRRTEHAREEGLRDRGGPAACFDRRHLPRRASGIRTRCPPLSGDSGTVELTLPSQKSV